MDRTESPCRLVGVSLPRPFGPDKPPLLVPLDRLWRAFTQEYVRHLFLHVFERVREARPLRWARWHNAERPRQGLGQRTPDEVCRGKGPKDARPLTAGMWSVRFLAGDHRLPIPRLTRAA